MFRVRELANQGATAAEIAAALDLDLDRVHDFLRRLVSLTGQPLARPRPRAKQRRIDNPRPRRPRPPKQPRQPKPRVLDAWKMVALEDPRFRDPESTLAAPELVERRELLDQAAAELAPDPATEPRPPIASSWGSVHASGPRKITAQVLAEALQLREAEWSWPAIARKFGCHRMAFYHALRRPPQ